MKLEITKCKYHGDVEEMIFEAYMDLDLVRAVITGDSIKKMFRS